MKLQVAKKVYTEVQKAFNEGYTSISAQGSSRCFAKGTLVRMFDGTLKAVENIVVGDKVMNIEGNGYNTVTETHSGVDEMYLIHQHRGMDYVVNSKHILSLKHAITGEIQDIPTDIYYNNQFALKGHFFGFKANGEETKIEVIPQGKGEYYGFTLDNSPYFLLRDGTVVHNSGKTYNIMIWIIMYCLKHKKTIVTIARCSLPTIKGTVFKDMISILESIKMFDIKKLNKTVLKYTFSNGSTIEFIGTEDPQKLRGRQQDILYLNECNEILYDSYFQLNMRTTKITIVDYNPSFSEEHWLNNFNALPTTYHFITTYKDNPFLEQRVIDEIESLQWLNPSLWQIYGLGQRAIVEGLVFKNVETVKEFPHFVKKRWVGVDFGFSQDPTAIVLVGQNDNELYIKEIAYQKNLLSRDIAQILCKSSIKHLPIICDSADPRLRKEIINVGRDVYRTDLEIIPVKKGNSASIMPSLDKMSLYNIKVTENSLNVIKEFRNYTYVKDREGNWLNKPIEKFNHAIDATRYVVMTKLLGQKKHRGIRTYR